MATPIGDAKRIIVNDDGLQLTITVKPKKNYPVLMFLGIWLAGWTVGGIAAGYEFFWGDKSAPDAFLAVWLFMWAIFWAFAFVSLLWMLAGREIITCMPEEISLRYEILGIGWTRKYAVADIEIFSLAPTMNFPFPPFISFGGIYGGPIWFKLKRAKGPLDKFLASSFSYGTEKGIVRIGSGLILKDAKEIAQAIKNRAGIKDSQHFGI